MFILFVKLATFCHCTTARKNIIHRLNFRVLCLKLRRIRMMFRKCQKSMFTLRLIATIYNRERYPWIKWCSQQSRPHSIFKIISVHMHIHEFKYNFLVHNKMLLRENYRQIKNTEMESDFIFYIIISYIIAENVIYCAW